MDWQAIGAAVGGLAIGAGGVFAAWRRREVHDARDKAEVAEHQVHRSRATAETRVYELLAARLTEVEDDVKRLRRELANEREWARELEKHIYHLENLMRAAGMDPPERVYVMGGRA